MVKNNLLSIIIINRRRVKKEVINIKVKDIFIPYNYILKYKLIYIIRILYNCITKYKSLRKYIKI